MTEFNQPIDNTAQQRTTPYNELDMTMLVTDPAWGREASSQLHKKVSKALGEAYYVCADCGKTVQKDDYHVDKDLKALTFKCSNPECEGTERQSVIDTEPLWGLLSYYTRDLRLGNLSSWNDEVKYCHHWLSLAGDCLRLGFINSFLSALSRVIDRLEISQSKGGFYRKRMGTVTSEQIRSDLEPSNNKNLFTNQPRKKKD